MGSLLGFFQIHPLGTYFLLAFGIAWGGTLLAVGPQELLHGLAGGVPLAQGIPGTAALVFPAMLLGPSMACILTTAAVDGKRGLAKLLARLLYWRVDLRWYAVALLITPFPLLMVLVPLTLTSSAFTPRLLAQGRTSGITIGLMIAGLAAGFFEELGWTGFALPRLLRGRNLVAVAIGFGALHMAWHFLADWWGSSSLYGELYPVHFLLWLAALIGLRFIIVRIYSVTECVLLAQLTHASSTGSQLLLGPVGLSAPDELLWYSLFVVTLWILIAVLFVTGGWQPISPATGQLGADEVR
jgi:membrane protease YdiL (CAAX protease family)